MLKSIYARSVTGAIQEWSIEVNENKYRTVYGQIDGKKITTEWTIAKPTNVGRSNERNGEQQAVFEATAIYKDKLQGGYWEDIKDIDKIRFIEPMLAQNFKDRIDEIDWARGVYIQPKLDGNRCIDYASMMQSRNGKPFYSCPHIHRKLATVFAKYPYLKFDGELYADKFANDFNRLSSIIRKKKPTENDLMESDALVQYWIYDIVDTTLLFSERNQIIQNIFKEFKLDCSFVYVPTILVHSKQEADVWYEKWISEGMEGQMVRINEYYLQYRSPYLLKRKEFQDREYPIVDICEGDGNKTGMAGYMILRNDDGETFNSNIKGNRAYLKELLVNAPKLIGRQATVKFFNLTPDKKVPRFPYVIKIRDDFDV